MMPLAFSRPAGFSVAPTELPMLLRMCSGFHSISRRLPDRLRGEFGDRGIDEDIAARRLHADDLRVDGRVGGLVGRLDDDHRAALSPSPSLTPLR